ncbi:MAG: tRNA (adenosine(37)-N6)-threonylcarbamoyltransferase complex transferase subunit TsaD [Peptostreptococcaceae bacterium]|nr:tRNA (adenosine(37)-N6)-threonylcarbamoyltransferase complex transferase subunit TsaD [Peptostreptococcaceae bacterium]
MKKEKDVLILGIESSCDETAASVVKNGRHVLSNVVLSQIDIHKRFGGVVPEVASRKHVEAISQVIDEALKLSKVKLEDLDAIGSTYGPGLVGALLIGLSTAKGLSYGAGKPFVAVNHIEGHICANFIEHKQLEPPFVGLVVSGGHTHLVNVLDYGKYEILGKTLDDAAGEAFDKISRALGLGYPGGPLIDKEAMLGNPEAIHFPRAYLKKGSLDFSFSGLKSAVLNYLNECKMKDIEINRADVAASFQEAVVEVLVEKSIMALSIQKSNRLVVSGGVAANSRLRALFKEKSEELGFEYYFPSMALCTDNAAMVASAAYFDFKAGNIADLYANAVPNLALGSKYKGSK